MAATLAATRSVWAHICYRPCNVGADYFGGCAAMNLPRDEDRTACLGRTGSGKTTFSMWLLSGTNFQTERWVIYNTKGDKLINQIAAIPGVRTLAITETPDEPGLYIYNPRPDQQLEIDASFRRIWDIQNCGVVIDEGYMIEVEGGFNALLTQGRSRKIPMIVCSQRPAWISKYVFSEASFVSVFQLQHLGDRKNVAQFVPLDINYRLPRHCSFWYDVGEHTLYRLSPVPPAPVIVENFRRALTPPEGTPNGEPASLQKNEQTVRRTLVI